MTVLQELVALYEARAADRNWPKPGYSSEKIGGAVVLREDGSVELLRMLMSPDAKGKRLNPRILSVPIAIKRASGIKPNRFWDKTAYVLGITSTENGPGQGKRTLREHDAFKSEHLALLEGATDAGLLALARFCETWTPEMFADHANVEALVDQNLIFEFDGAWLHDRPAARECLAADETGNTLCLVTGTRSATARLHPSIKGVMGAQSSGASLVSFNNDAETSHGKFQGDNAPVSEEAAFAYGTALNALLAKGSGNNLRVGGDTIAFWADQPEAETTFAAFLSGADQPDPEQELTARLSALAQGRARSDEPLQPDTRLFVLGLAPNAARLSVRYWLPSTVGNLAKAATLFWDQCAILPSPFVKSGLPVPPKPWALLYDLAAQRDEKNISPKLGGELMRAILTQGDFPATILTAALMRLRVEGDPDRARHGNVDGRRAALIRAVLIRNYKMEVPMALDETAHDPAYLLGRLFAAYVYAERSYQERGASLRSKYMGAASATPARVFPQLMRGYEHNLSSLRKAGGQRAGAGVKADRAVTTIIAGLDGGAELPPTLSLEDQGRFFIGFYHQMSAFYSKAEDAVEDMLIEGEEA